MVLPSIFFGLIGINFVPFKSIIRRKLKFPEHGKAIVDHGVGYAVGHDAIGHFDHHTGPFGPFGFYANYYHD